MPELPEVETVVRRLRPALTGRRIERAQVSWPRTIATPSAAAFTRRLRGQEIESLGRRAKYLLFNLSGGDTLVTHLRMTGDYGLAEAGSPADPYTRARFALDDGHELRFSDVRKFGRIALTDDVEAYLSHIGPEPLARAFTAKTLAAILQGRSTPIKPFLLNQEHIAGLGNIYADEALHFAAIHPLRAAGSLTPDEIKRLHEGIQFVLRKGIRLGGSTLYDLRFRDPFGRTGKMQEEFVVYHDPRREEKICPRCGSRIVHQVIAQRSAHFCPGCQR
jgi:formamidopyrimidine-DNA glycosylase